MPQRLATRFKTGDQVEIYLQIGANGAWQAGKVLYSDPPGLWIETDTGQRWYVTNGRRIRMTNKQQGDS